MFNTHKLLQAQAIAASALLWAKSLVNRAQCAKQDDLVSQIAGVGASGRHASNCERDLHNILRLRNMTLDVPISKVPVRLFDFNQPLPVMHPEHAKRPRGKKVMIVRKPMDVIFPDDLILAIWHNRGEEGFKKLFLPSRVDARSYWEHVETHCPWFQDHPARGWNCARDKMIPFSFYGDEVAAYKTEAGSVSIFAFTTDFSMGESPLKRYFLCNCYAEHLATEHTFSDLLKGLMPRMKKLLSLEGNYPWQAKGYQFVYSSTQGDLKHLHQHFGVQPYRNNAFCSYCTCKKVDENDPTNTLGDFRACASHLGVRRNHGDFLATTPPENRDMDCMQEFFFCTLALWVLRSVVSL